MEAPRRLPRAKPAITSAAVIPVWKMRLFVCHMRRNSWKTSDSGGTMKGGIPSNCGPHCQPARKRISSTKLAKAPWRMRVAGFVPVILGSHAVRHFRGMADVKTIHQPRHVVLDAMIAPPSDWILSVRNVDAHFVDDLAWAPAHYQNAI